MKVAIDISPLRSAHKFRGIGEYTKSLVRALQSFKVANFSIQLIKEKKTISDVDLIHYPYFDLFWLTLPLRKPYPTVVTVHDLIPLVFPDKFPKGVKGWVRYQIQRQSLLGAKAIITDSQNSKKDVIRFIGFPKEKIYVVYLAPGEEFRRVESTRRLHQVREKYKLPLKFVLYVGDVNYNKNVLGLIKAFKQIPIPEVKLVLVGKAFLDKGLKETKEILQLIKSLDLTNQTKILGFVPTEDLVAIYNLATVYCQPTFYEGFGLPVLEAMACGTPVVAGNTSSLPEICDNAALMVDPYDINDIARGISQVLCCDVSMYRSMSRKGLVQAKKFSWEKTARETIGVYKETL